MSIGLITTLGSVSCYILLPACKVEMRVERQLFWKEGDAFVSWHYCIFFHNMGNEINSFFRKLKVPEKISQLFTLIFRLKIRIILKTEL